MEAAGIFPLFCLKSLSLLCWIVMAPMTRKRSPGEVPDADVADYYRRRAKGGVGLILTEGVAVGHPAAVYDSDIASFHGEDALAGWTQVLAAVRAEGGRIMPQLWHVGAFRKLGDGPNADIPPVAPSGLYDPHTRVSGHRQLGGWPACEMELSWVGGGDDNARCSQLRRLPVPG